MQNIRPEAENAADLSEHEVWLSESQDSICDDAAHSSKQVADTSKWTSHSPSQSQSKETIHSTENTPTGAFSSQKVSESSENELETSSQPLCNDTFILPLESDEISRVSENPSTRIIPSKEIAHFTERTTLEAPSRPRCRDGSSLSSISDEEISRLSESSTTRIIPNKETVNTKGTSSQSVCRDESSSSLDLQMSLAPTCKDGSSLSLYSDEETTSVSERTLARIGYANESVSSSSESEIEEDNILSELPHNLVAQTPQVLVDNSSDVHIGPHFQYSGPITVKQYITVSGREAIEADKSPSVSKVPTQMPHLKEIVNVTLKPQAKEGNNEVLTDLSHGNNIRNFVINDNYNSKVSNGESYLNNGDKINGNHISQDVLLNGSEDNLLKVKKIFLKKRYILICLVSVLILCICVSLSLVLPGSSEMNPRNINITSKFKNLRVSQGEKTVQWAVDVTSSIGRLNVEWYGPGCKLIERKYGPSKYKIETAYQENGKMQTVLKVVNVTNTDRGLYKLHVYNDKDEEWDYFTLTVLGYEHMVACYVAEWAHLRVGLGMFTVDEIDPAQCTHLIYAFANLNTTSNTIYPAEPGYDLGSNGDKGAYEKMTSLKQKYPHLKVLISMGGWAERENKNYSIVAKSPDSRKEFAASVVDFIRKHNFDGFDLHWQYPTEQNGRPPDKQNFVYMLKELREEFDKQGQNWLLTAPLGVLPNTIKAAYDIPEITKYLHYMFAFCYAYHGFWDMQTGPNAPLYRSKAGDEFNVDASIQKLLDMGAQPEKLVLAVPLYGRTFILENEEDSEGFGAPTVGNGFTGPYVQEPGFMGYNEICEELGKKNSNWKIHWDEVTHTPYTTNKKKFISYDNERSLTEKVEFALKNNLAGIVAYSLDTDDFRGVCAFDRTGVTNYPLMRAINNAFYTASYGAMEPCGNRTKLS